ncbi:MAG: hypothetical protein U0Q10_10545 [Dermatophilaceae bacterium]
MTRASRSTAVLAAATGLLGLVGAAQAAPAAAPSAAATNTAAQAPLVCSTLGAPPKAARAYADRLLAAWAAGKRDVAKCYTAYATDAILFGEKPRGGAWTWVSTVANTPEQFDDVTYRNAAGERIQVRVARPAAGAWDRVTGVQMTGTTGRISTYADNLIRAWGRGDKAAALKYGTPKAVNALWAFSGGAGGGCWQRTFFGGGYTTMAIYSCESATVELTIQPGAAAAGKPQAVVKAQGFGAD